MAKTTKTRKTRKTRSPQPIPAMLEGAFATRLENTIAEMNNALAREGRLTSDPAFVMLQTIRKELVKEGVATFDRAVAGAPSPAPSQQAPAAPAQSRKRSQSEASTPAEPTEKPQVRECSEDEVLSLVVEGTMGSEGAPYGRDKKGLALAPYGVKLDGTPKLRRGRGVPPWEREPEAEGSSDSESSESTDSAEASSDSESTEAKAEASDSGDSKEAETETAEASDSDSSDSEEDVDEDEDALDLDDDDLDELLNTI